MGLLSEGKPLSWPETKKHAQLVHKVGVQQFLAIYHRLKDRRGDQLKWGDEVGERRMKKTSRGPDPHTFPRGSGPRG